MSWSGAISSTWPSPTRQIYLHTLKQLGTSPDETLFIDDKRVNVDAALALGMKAIEFSTIDRLRADLVAAGLESRVAASLNNSRPLKPPAAHECLANLRQVVHLQPRCTTLQCRQEEAANSNV